MADTLVDDYDVVDLLTGLADRCVTLPGVSAAGVMLASPAGHLGLSPASSTLASDRSRSDRPDLRHAQVMWPRFARHA
jgi:hypothetical protein